MRGSLRWLHDPEAGMFNPSNNELLFHADYMYVPECVLRGLSLSAHELEGSSITRFADMVRAVERLPADLRARINGLLVENTVDRSGWRVGGTRYRTSTRRPGLPDALWPPRRATGSWRSILSPVSGTSTCRP
jgi:alpha-ketoglutarate-dependent taurine dioxygenase